MDVIRSDVLVIGGGIAGCFAAIRASELGRRVVLLDKASIRRSGSVGPGMDEMNMGIAPGGLTLEEAKRQVIGKRKELYDPNVLLAVEKASYQRVLDFDKFGVPMREDDGSFFIITIPERPEIGSMVCYRGVDTKVKLAEAVRKTTTNIIERTMGVDLLTHDGSVIGAVALNVRNGNIAAFLSKATILCTGSAGRQYIEPDGLFLTWHSTTNTGDAEAMAYRAGAKLGNMEYIFLDYALARAGGGIPGVLPYATMDEMHKMPILVNRQGQQVLKKGESKRRGFVMAKEIAEGRGPLYWDFRSLPEETLKVVERKMSHEYPITKEWFKIRGLDIRKTLIPNQLVPAAIVGGPIVNETFEASMKGLYVAGDSTAFLSGLTLAAASGHISAETAARYASDIEEPLFQEKEAEDITKQTTAPLKRSGGTRPIDLEEAVRGINTDYVGYFKTEEMLQAGLEKLLALKNTYLPSLYARNPHELMRCIEVRNIFDMAEMHIRASMMRKESRIRRVGLIPHYRVDYPKTDPAWEKLIVIVKESGEMKLSTQEIPKLKEG